MNVVCHQVLTRKAYSCCRTLNMMAFVKILKKFDKVPANVSHPIPLPEITQMSISERKYTFICFRLQQRRYSQFT
jgi:SPX domain protein involved in polyphosphate accumulation